MNKIIAYKKSIPAGIGFLFFIQVCVAQDAAAIKARLKQRDYARAKETIDKLCAESATAENYLLKAVVYDSVAKSSTAIGLLADARWQSFIALQKAALLKKEYVFTQGQELAKDLQQAFIHEGLTTFNAAAERSNRAGFESALAIFKKAAQVNEFIYQLKWDSTSINSLLLLLLAKSAIYSEKEEDALFYSKKIVDNFTENTSHQTGSEIVYQWLLYYCGNRKEAAAFNKYLALAKAAYPANQYFVLAEMDWLRQQQDYVALFEKYRQLITAEPGNLQYKLTYSTDIFKSLWPVKNTGASITANQLLHILKPLAAAKQTASKAQLLLAKTYTNMAQDVLKESKQNNTIIVKKQHSNYLLLANKYLRQIIATKENINKPEWKEAKLLLAKNTKALKLTKDR